MHDGLSLLMRPYQTPNEPSTGPVLLHVILSVASSSGGRYSGIVDCFVKTLVADGPMAFYKGFIPNFSRMASWNVAMFMTLEQARRLARSLGSADQS